MRVAILMAKGKKGKTRVAISVAMGKKSKTRVAILMAKGKKSKTSVAIGVARVEKSETRVAILMARVEKGGMRVAIGVAGFFWGEGRIKLGCYMNERVVGGYMLRLFFFAILGFKFRVALICCKGFVAICREDEVASEAVHGSPVLRNGAPENLLLHAPTALNSHADHYSFREAWG